MYDSLGVGEGSVVIGDNLILLIDDGVVLRRYAVRPSRLLRIRVGGPEDPSQSQR